MIEEKLHRLQDILGDFPSALVAYSGGLDSAFLLKVAHDQIGEKTIALTALSPSFPSYEREQAAAFARKVGVSHLWVESREVEEPDYRANRGDRCYHCKSELYEICREKGRELGIEIVLNGTQQDDLGDIRPGMRAASEYGVRSPLLEAGLAKKEIRELARVLGLEIWNKPAQACLSSRFPVGIEVTEERLRRIDQIESGLIALGFQGVRVRFHEPIARIEVPPEEIARFVDPSVRKEVSRLCHANGFAYATVDLDGYRTGGASQPIKISL